MRWHADRIARALPVLVSLAVFLAALEILRLELQAIAGTISLRDVLATPARQLVLALLLTALNYALLTGYDLLAFRVRREDASGEPHRRRSLPRLRHLAQRRVCGAVGRVGALPVLFALGRDRRRALAHRVQLLRDVLAGAAGARQA